MSVRIRSVCSRARGVVRCATLLVLAVALAYGDASAQAPPSEAQVKAAFVYNFLKFVDWPPGTFAGPRDSLVVGIVGRSSTADATASFLEGKQVNNRPLAVRRMPDDTVITGVHAIFVGDVEQGRRRQILATIASTTILSIGETADFAARGGVIRLLVEEQKVRFEINTDAADTARLKISSKLLALAKLVRTPKQEQAP